MGRSLAVVAVLASVVWGVTLLRGAGGTSLAELERLASTLLDAGPRLVMEGIESMPARLRPDASGGGRSEPQPPPPGPAADAALAGAPGDVPDAPAEDESAAPERGTAIPTPSIDIPARSDPQPAAADPRTAALPPAPLSPSSVLPLPPAPEPVQAPGSLFLQAYPWGRVYVDGVYVGNTPLVGAEVGAGVRWIRVERPGYEPHVEYVVVEPAQELRLTGIILTRGRP